MIIGVGKVQNSIEGRTCIMDGCWIGFGRLVCDALMQILELAGVSFQDSDSEKLAALQTSSCSGTVAW